MDALRSPIRLCTAVALLAAASAGADTFTFSKLALEGEPVPAGGGTYATFFSGLDLDDAGGAGIVVGVSGAPDHQAVLVFRDDGSVERVNSTDSPPAALGGSYSYLGPPGLNAAGDYVFHVGATPANAWLLESGSGLEVVARVGDPVPGVTGSTYDDNPDAVTVDDAGRVLLGTALANPGGSQTALLSIDGASVDVVAIAGDAAPTPSASAFTVIDPEADTNASGTTVFFAHTDAAGVGARGVFARESATLVPIALEGEASPVGGRTFSFASNPTPRINDAGKTVFYAFLNPIGTSPNQGIFLDDGASTQALVLAGDPVPDDPARTFSTFGRPHVGAGDVVTFLAYSSDAHSNLFHGLYRLRDGALSTIIESGDALPGAGGATLTTLSYFSLRANDLGAVLFQAALSDGRSGVFLAEPNPIGAPSLGPAGFALLVAAVAGLGARRAPRRRAHDGRAGRDPRRRTALARPRTAPEAALYLPAAQRTTSGGGGLDRVAAGGAGRRRPLAVPDRGGDGPSAPSRRRPLRPDARDPVSEPHAHHATARGGFRGVRGAGGRELDARRVPRDLVPRPALRRRLDVPVDRPRGVSGGARTHQPR